MEEAEYAIEIDCERPNENDVLCRPFSSRGNAENQLKNDDVSSSNRNSPSFSLMRVEEHPVMSDLTSYADNPTISDLTSTPGNRTGNCDDGIDRGRISQSFSFMSYGQTTATNDDDSATSLGVSTENDEVEEEDEGDEPSILYDMDLRPHPGLRQLCEVPLGGEGKDCKRGVKDEKWEDTTSDEIMVEDKISSSDNGTSRGIEKQSPLLGRKIFIPLIAAVTIFTVLIVSILVTLLQRDTGENENTATAIQAPDDTGTVAPEVTLDPEPLQPHEVVFTTSPDSGNTAIEIAVPTSIPTKHPSLIPTQYPSTLPTATPTINEAYAFVLDYLRPIDKQEALLDGSTPQGLAFLKIVADNEDTFEILTRSKAIEMYAVLTLYLSTSPEIWESNFASILSTSDICAWHEVIECGERPSGERDVETIKLNRMNLHGSIPEEICLLDSLVRLDISGNNLVGSIPECLNGSNNLKSLHLDGNYLVGSIPQGMLLVPTLEELQVSNNLLTGNLDSLIEGTFIGNMYRYGETWRLRRLAIENNAITGTVPAYFGALAQLQYFTLHGNALQGQINDMLCERATENPDFGQPLIYLSADCQEVICPCCNRCY